MTAGPARLEQTRQSAHVVRRVIGPIMTVAGGIGLLAASTLMVEKVDLLEDPTNVPSCDIDAVLSCGTVMTSSQAEAFWNIPNPVVGIAGFGAMLALGFCLINRTQLTQAVWRVIQAGMVFAVLFVHWLMFQSLYRIEALCPYCMLVWVVVIASFVYVTVHNIAEERLGIGLSRSRAGQLVVRNHGVVVSIWLSAVAILVAEAFWSHWKTVI